MQDTEAYSSKLRKKKTLETQDIYEITLQLSQKEPQYQHFSTEDFVDPIKTDTFLPSYASSCSQVQVKK